MSAQGMPGPDDLSEEELREYLGQLRGARADDVIAQTFSMLAQAAQVKLGRNDGRLMIDTAAAVANEAKPFVDQRLSQEMDRVIGQLRMAQVEAEKEIAQAREAGEEFDEPNDLGDRPGGRGGQAPPAQTPPPSQQQPQQPPQQPQQPGGGRLWTPGG